jgi:hypothetical protein
MFVMEKKEPQTTLGLVTEIGTFGSLNMKDPTVSTVKNLMEKTSDPYLKQYLQENADKFEKS